MQQTNLTINQSTDWNQTIVLNNQDGTPMNLVNFSFQSAFRTSYWTPNVAGNLTCTITDTSNGIVIIGMNHVNTANITATTYVYDVLMTDPNGNINRILEGTLTFTPGATIR